VSHTAATQIYTLSLHDALPIFTPDDSGNPTVNFHGERRSNATHASTTDPQALLYRKGARREAKLCYQGHVLMENRHGLAVDGCRSEEHTSELQSRSDLVCRLLL